MRHIDNRSRLCTCAPEIADFHDNGANKRFSRMNLLNTEDLGNIFNPNSIIKLNFQLGRHSLSAVFGQSAGGEYGFRPVLVRVDQKPEACGFLNLIEDPNMTLYGLISNLAKVSVRSVHDSSCPSNK